MRNRLQTWGPVDHVARPWLVCTLLSFHRSQRNRGGDKCAGLGSFWGRWWRPARGAVPAMVHLHLHLHLHRHHPLLARLRPPRPAPAGPAAATHPPPAGEPAAAAATHPPPAAAAVMGVRAWAHRSTSLVHVWAPMTVPCPRHAAHPTIAMRRMRCALLCHRCAREARRRRCTTTAGVRAFPPNCARAAMKRCVPAREARGIRSPVATTHVLSLRHAMPSFPDATAG